jgi:pyruvate kinase
MRLGIFGEDKVELYQEIFCLTTDSVVGTKELASVNYSQLPHEINVGDEILLADGLLSLRVEKIEESKIYTKVVHGGTLSSRKRVAVPGAVLNLPFISVEDRVDIEFAVKQDMDYIAASFVQKAEDVLAIRKLTEELVPK